LQSDSSPRIGELSPHARQENQATEATQSRRPSAREAGRGAASPAWHEPQVDDALAHKAPQAEQIARALVSSTIEFSCTPAPGTVGAAVASSRDQGGW
jgi:hypothetical protein